MNGVTTGRIVRTVGGPFSTGIDSRPSMGNTSRNQPTLPTIMRTMPSIEIEGLVTNPAKSSVTAEARTIGNAVGAGISSAVGAPASLTLVASLFAIPISSRSPSNDVDDGEHDDPDRIDEMPVERQHLDASAVLRSDLPSQREQENGRQSKKPDRHMEGVQADQ